MRPVLGSRNAIAFPRSFWAERRNSLRSAFSVLRSAKTGLLWGARILPRFFRADRPSVEEAAAGLLESGHVLVVKWISLQPPELLFWVRVPASTCPLDRPSTA